jgi:hypothetical protein
LHTPITTGSVALLEPSGPQAARAQAVTVVPELLVSAFANGVKIVVPAFVWVRVFTSTYLALAVTFDGTGLHLPRFAASGVSQDGNPDTLAAHTLTMPDR